jgi:hypothetical protein
MRNAYKILVGKLEGEKELGRPTHKCKNKTKLDLR